MVNVYHDPEQLASKQLSIVKLAKNAGKETPVLPGAYPLK